MIVLIKMPSNANGRSPLLYPSWSPLLSEQLLLLMAWSTVCLMTCSSTWFSPPTASRRKVSSQDAVASSTLRPSSSKASRIETSNPGQLLSENTLMRNPCPRVSTVTVGMEFCLSAAASAHAISLLSLTTFCFSSLMYSDASVIMEVLLSCHVMVTN
jgi:hypothetical protein